MSIFTIITFILFLFRKTPVLGRLAASTHLKNVIVNGNIDLSLNEFEKLFIAEGAPYSLARYHESVQGTEAVEATQWKEVKSDSSSAIVYEREISFTHGSLIRTRCVKSQKFYKDKDCLVIRSSTAMKDVPEADAFAVDDVLVVTVDEANKLKVEISREIVWHRGSLLKWPIESNTNRETQKWQKDFFAHLVEVSRKAAEDREL
jgi:hypothetical protein